MSDAWNMRTRLLAPLKVGDHVFIQNQEGNYLRRWDKRGQVVEVKGYDQYIVRVDGSRRLTRRNRKFLRKFEQYKPDGMNAQQVRTPQEGLSGMRSPAIAREEPLQRLDQPTTSVRETPRNPPQDIQQPPHTAPVSIDDWRTGENVQDAAIPRVDTSQQGDERNQVVEDQNFEEDVQQQVERAHQGNGNVEAPQEQEEPVEVPAASPVRRSTRAGRGTTHKFDDYVRLEGLEASATYKNEAPSFFEEGGTSLVI